MPINPAPSGRGHPAPRRIDRRAALRGWGSLVATALAGGALTPGAAGAQEVSPPTAPTDGAIPPTVPFGATAGAARLTAAFDPSSGAVLIPSLAGPGQFWVPASAPRIGCLWIEGVAAEGSSPVTIDGSGGLELLASTAGSVALLHRQTGLQLDLAIGAARGESMVHQLALTNARARDNLRVGRAATLSLPVWAGDVTEALGVDDAPNGWTTPRRELPVSYGHHGSRSGDSGVYPLVRLETLDGSGLIVAVSSATAWRIEIGLADQLRTIRAGEYRSDLTLAPGERAALPEVVTIFYRGGASGAVEALRVYLEGISPRPSQAWRDGPPGIFNTWFAYGIGLFDDGRDANTLRTAARTAAAAGLEVFVVDAGWYVGNPLPAGFSAPPRAAPQTSRSDDEDDGDDAPPPPATPTGGSKVDFDPGLGAWVENPDKWRAVDGQGGSPNSGLRNFSDYVHSLTVRPADGRPAGRMRFGLWFEPERFDPEADHPERVPDDWAIPGTAILDFSRPEVVDAIGGRLQRAIDAYRLDYIKIDANRGLWAEVDGAPAGHFWTRWSAGFERLLDNLGRANPGLYVEHCAGGLKRYWIGVGTVADSTWLDDDVTAGNVGRLLDATDGLLLPRQKTVLITEELRGRAASVQSICQAYWGGERRNGGSLGFSSRLDRWGEPERSAAAWAIEAWKQIR